MRDNASFSHPAPGDYVVLYPPCSDGPHARLTIVRWSADGTSTLIRATFHTPAEAGPRFEAQARLMAAGTGTRSFRGVDGQYTRLDASVGDGGP